MTQTTKPERIQKILAQLGLTSRRKAEELIAQGSVTVNGKIANLGDKALLGGDAIKVRGKLIQNQAEPRTYLLLNKPRKVLSTLHDPEGRLTLTDFIKHVPARVYPVGRLDFNTEGLILLTNDGEMAEKIQKSPELFRCYLVKIKGHLDEERLARLQRPGRLDSGKWLHPHTVRLAQGLEKKSQVEVILQGSGAFDLKQFFELKGFLVNQITRTSIGQLTLRGLQPGEFRHLRESQVLALIQQPELAVANRKPSKSAPLPRSLPPH